MIETTLLPPNATPIERSYAASGAQALQLDYPIESLWDAARCPAPLLPWLAWALSVDIWSDAWPEAVKRRAIAAAPDIHRHKGTLEAVEGSLAVLGCACEIVEWFNMIPAGRRGTFRVIAYAGERLTPQAPLITPELLDAARRAIRAAKPKSRAFDVQFGVDASHAPIRAAAIGRPVQVMRIMGAAA